MVENVLFYVLSVRTLVGDAVTVKGDAVAVMQGKSGCGALCMQVQRQSAKREQQNGGYCKDS